MKILMTGTTGMLGRAVRDNFEESFPEAEIFLLNRTYSPSFGNFVNLGVQEIFECFGSIPCERQFDGAVGKISPEGRCLYLLFLW